MNGMFHSLKKTLGGSAKSIDSKSDVDFIEAKIKFDQYSETLLKLKGNIATYLAHVTAIYIGSSQIAQDFTTLIEDPEQQKIGLNEYSLTATSLRQEHSTLASEYVPKLQQHFSTTLLANIDEELCKNVEMKKRIEKRTELFSELGYYQKKVNELRDERTARSAKGKPESASDKEKEERNEKKLSEITTSFNEMNTKLMADLGKLWTVDRIQICGPLMINFLKQERLIAETYGVAVATVKG